MNVIEVQSAGVAVAGVSQIVLQWNIFPVRISKADGSCMMSNGNVGYVLYVSQIRLRAEGKGVGGNKCNSLRDADGERCVYGSSRILESLTCSR